MNRVIIISFCLLTACNLLGGGDSNYDPEIVFSAEDKNGTSQIYTMNEDGSNITKITNWEDDSVQPSWHPDGEHILFSTFRQTSSLGPGMWVMDADGGNKEPLYFPDEATNPMEGNNARWSPDGKKVVFDLCIDCQVVTNYDLILFNNETKELKKLAESPYNETNPVWSPDGTKIAFMSDRDYADSSYIKQDLYVINSKGSRLQRITKYGLSGGYKWMDTETIILTETDSNKGIKYISVINTETRKINPLVEDLDVKDQLWVFWDSDTQQLFTLNKNHEELPLIIASYNKEGNLLEEFQLHSKKLKTAISFDWHNGKEN